MSWKPPPEVVLVVTVGDLRDLQTEVALAVAGEKSVVLAQRLDFDDQVIAVKEHMQAGPRAQLHVLGEDRGRIAKPPSPTAPRRPCASAQFSSRHSRARTRWPG